MVCLQLCPSFLIKKDRGRPTDPKAKPKEFGEVSVVSNVPGAELLENGDEPLSGDEDESDIPDTDESDEDKMEGSDSEGDGEEMGSEEEDNGEEVESGSDTEGGDDNGDDGNDESDYMSDSDDCTRTSSNHGDDDDNDDDDGKDGDEDTKVGKKPKGLKRKFSDYEAQLDVVDQSLRTLKRLAYSKMARASSDMDDGILSNEDFHRIRELKVVIVIQ